MGKLIPSVPLWKYGLSFIAELLLESYSSDQNGHLELYLVKGKLMLCAENAIYSYDDRYLNFVRSFEALESEQIQKMESVLVLGMGMCSIPIILEKKYKKKFHFVLVEYDETIAWMAQKYSLPRLKSSVELRIQDAAFFIQLVQDKYDLICVDLFKDQEVPDVFRSQLFLQECKERLSDKGMLIYNSPGNTDEERYQSNQFFEDVFKAVFPNSKLRNLHKNVMLFSH